MHKIYSNYIPNRLSFNTERGQHQPPTHKTTTSGQGFNISSRCHIIKNITFTYLKVQTVMASTLGFSKVPSYSQFGYFD